MRKLRMDIRGRWPFKGRGPFYRGGALGAIFVFLQAVLWCSRVCSQEVPSDTLQAPPPAPPPVEFALEPVLSEGKLVVRWEGYSASVGGFRVYLSTKAFGDVEGLKPVREVGGDVRSVSLEGLKVGKVYWVAVTAVGEGGEGVPLPRQVCS